MKKAWNKIASYKSLVAKRRRKIEVRQASFRKHKKTLYKKNRKKNRLKPLVLKAPSRFDLINSGSRSELLTFLRKMSTNIRTSARPIHLNFSATENMISDATLLFKAELCRSLQTSKSYNIPTITPPKSTKIDQVLKQIGVYDLVGHTSKVQLSHPDVINWRYANGDEVVGEKYDEILGHYDGVIHETLASGLYLGITEAMTNCHHHAYIEKRGDGLNIGEDEVKKNWWMFSQEKDGVLHVVFGDLGIGIPKSLPIKQPGLWGNIKKKLGLSPRDADVINEAILESKSRTGKSYRGKGLKQLVEAIETTDDAELLLYSNRGLYTHVDGESKIYNFRNSIYGTLVYWSVPVA